MKQKKNELQKRLKNVTIIAGISLGIIYFLSTTYGKPSYEPATHEKTVITDKDNDEIKEVIDSMPTYPGGNKALREFISKNLEYPEKAQKKGIQGKVFVVFVVEKDGKITNVRVIKSVNKYLDKEAMRVIKLMPKWNPGMQKGKPVRVKFTVPINFVLK